MYKKILWVMSVAFCLNVFLSVLPSCKRRGGSRTGSDACSTPNCFNMRSASLKLYDGKDHTYLDSQAYSCVSTDLVIQAYMEGDISYCVKERPSESKGNLSLFSSAYAFVAYPACVTRQGNDSIVAYNIYSNADYDLQHPAGTSLNDIITTDDVPSRPLYGSVLYADFMVDKAPAQSGSYYSFTIVLTKKSGQTVYLTTPSIKML